MKKLFSKFKAFIAKGSVIDLAIGVIIGAGLFRHFYDELLLALDPRSRRYDD